MESDARFFRRRAAEERAAADRAVTAAARDRRLQLSQAFLVRLKELEERHAVFEWSDPATGSRQDTARTHRRVANEA